MAKNDSMNNSIDDKLFDDSFDSFDFGDPQTKSRKPAGPAKKIASNLLHMGAGFTKGAAKAVSESMPRTGELLKELKGFKSEAEALRQELQQELRPTATALKRAMYKSLPFAKERMPKKLYDLLERKLKPEEEYKYRAKSAEEEQSETIAGSLAEIFASQEKVRRSEREDSLAEKMVDRVLVAKRHKDELSALKSIDSRLLSQAKFMHTTQTAWMKKMLELQYIHVFTAKDHLAVGRVMAGMLEHKLEEIKHNTALPDIAKLKTSDMGAKLIESLRGTALAKISGVSQNYLAKVKKNLSDWFRSNVIGSVSLIRDVADQAEMGLDMAASMQDMGGDTKPKLGSGILGMLGGMLGTPVGRKLADFISPLLGEAEDAALNLQKTIYFRMKKQRDRMMLSGSPIASLLAAFIPEHTEQRGVVNTLLDKPTEPVPFDRATRQAIVEVIPGYLAKMDKSLRDIVMGKSTEMEVYDPTSRMFQKMSVAKEAMVSRAFGDVRTRAQETIGAVGVIRGAVRHKTGEKGAETFKSVQRDVFRFITNIAVNKQFLDPEKIKDFAESDNDDPTKAGQYIARNFVGLVSPKRTAQVLVSAMYRGQRLDIDAMRNIENAISDATQAESWKEILPRVLDEHGVWSMFKEMGAFDKNNNIRDEFLHDVLLNVSDTRLEEEAGATATISEFTQSMREQQRAKFAAAVQGSPSFKKFQGYAKEYAGKASEYAGKASGSMATLQEIELVRKLLKYVPVERLKRLIPAEAIASGRESLKANISRVFPTMPAGVGAESLGELANIGSVTPGGAAATMPGEESQASTALARMIEQARAAGGEYAAETMAQISSADAQAADTVGISAQDVVAASAAKRGVPVHDAIQALHAKIATNKIIQQAKDLQGRVVETARGAKETVTATAKGAYGTLSASAARMSEAASKMADAILGSGGKLMTVALAEETPDGVPTVMSKFHSDFLNYFEYRKAHDAVLLNAVMSLGAGGEGESQTAVTTKKSMLDRLGSILKGTGQAGGFIASQYTKLYGAMFKGAGTAISGAFGFGTKALPYLGKGAKNFTDLLGKVLLGGMDMYGKMYGSMFKAGGNVVSATIGALTGTGKPKFVDVYRKDQLPPEDPLVSARTQRKFGVFVDGTKLEQTADITKPLYHVKTKEILVSQEDIDAGLVDVYGKSLSRTIEGGGLLRSAFKGLGGVGRLFADLLIGGAGMYGNIYKGLAGLGGKLGKSALDGIFGLFGGGKQSKEIVSRLDIIIDLLRTRLPDRKSIFGDTDSDGYREGSYEDWLADKSKGGYMLGEKVGKIGGLVTGKQPPPIPGQPGAKQEGSSMLGYLLGAGGAGALGAGTLGSSAKLATQMMRHGVVGGAKQYLRGTRAGQLFRLGRLGLRRFGGTGLGRGLGRFGGRFAGIGGRAAGFGGRFASAAALPLLTAYEAASGLRETIGDSAATDAYAEELERKQAAYGGPLGSLAQVFGLENVAKEMEQGNYLKAGWQGVKGVFGSVAEAGKLVGANVNMGAQAIQESKGTEELQQLHQALIGIGAVKDTLGWGPWKIVSWHKIKTLPRRDLMTLSTSDKFSESDLDLIRKLAVDKYVNPKGNKTVASVDEESKTETPAKAPGTPGKTQAEIADIMRNKPGAFWDRMASLSEEDLLKRINNPNIREDDKAGYRRALERLRLNKNAMSEEADQALDEFGYTETPTSASITDKTQTGVADMMRNKPGAFWDHMASLSEEDLINRINSPYIREDDKAGYKRALNRLRLNKTAKSSEIVSDARLPNEPTTRSADAATAAYKKSAADRAAQDAMVTKAAFKPSADPTALAKQQVEQQSSMLGIFQQMAEYLKTVAANTDELGDIKTGLDDNLKDATKKQPVVVMPSNENKIKVDRPALNLAKAI